ncbi:MAG: glycosyltransferase family 4 protein [Syntrophobacterales bacterium]
MIGYILKGYPRISETFISNEIHLLENLDFSLHLFSMRQPRESFTHQSVKQIRAQVDYLPETLLAHLPCLLYHNLLLARSRPAAYSQAFRLMLTRFRRTKKVATIKHLFQAGYLVHSLLPGTGVRHLHAHFAHSPTSVALFANKLSGLAFSFTAHAKDIYTSDPRQLQEKIELAEFVVTCTDYNRSFLRGLSPGKNAIHRIYHGIDARFFSTPSQARKPSPPYRVLSIARLVEKKGLPTVFRALRHLADQGHSFRYTLIGDGEERQALLKFLHRLRLDNMCDWLGTQPHEKVLDQYRKADLFVLGCEVAKNGDRDGIPNVFLESMAMGVPVLATRVSAIPELVEDGRTGVLVEPGQPEAMAEGMARLLFDLNLRNRVIAGARQKVRDDFDNRKLINNLAALFEQAGLKDA